MNFWLEPDTVDDTKSIVGIKWQPRVGVVWQNLGDGNGVICEAASISAIRGDVPTGILQLGGPKNSAMITASEDF